ncbi:MAG: chemotaxis-specific protein-glutamate methyltransferase CheB [Polyangiales bacterium]
MSRSVRVLVVDDSATLRDLIVVLLKEDPSLEVVGVATNGRQALQSARALRPDVITMDVKMPEMGGLEAIRAIMSSDAPCPILVVCGVSEDEQALSFHAMSVGALELIAKPVATDRSSIAAWGVQLRESVRLMAEIPVVRRRRLGIEDGGGAGDGENPIAVVAIAASTGGPQVLAQILRELPSDLAAPLLIAQHIAMGFGRGLQRWLNEISALEVTIATDGETARAGKVYLAPDGHDLEIGSFGRLRTSKSTTLHSPSGNRLFDSVAAIAGSRGCALVLSGMGEDGATGVRAIRAAGGVALAQDQASSVVFGMPRAALHAGATEVALGQISSRLWSLCAGVDRHA